MCSDIAISVKNLTKTYRIFGHPTDRIKQMLTLGRVNFHKEFAALQDVSFEIKKGETVGIIGRNGSGKSTLLQLICGILKPTSGEVRVNGRISALLELGSGFNPEFTGRENVYFQGAIMGIAKDEMDASFSDIAEFADIGEFIDQPVRAYSSGMFVRLAFAVAINVNPDILIIDEALAVGDMAFQSKCLDKLHELQESGLTIILVAHSQSFIAELCTLAIQLGNGALINQGTPPQVLAAYEESMVQTEQRLVSAFRPGGNGIQICSVRVVDSTNQQNSHFKMHEPLTIEVAIVSGISIAHPCMGMEIRSSNGFILWSATSADIGQQLPALKINQPIHIRWKFTAEIASGTYSVAIGAGEITNGNYRRHTRLHHAGEFSIQYTGEGGHGYLPLLPIAEIVEASA